MSALRGAGRAVGETSTCRGVPVLNVDSVRHNVVEQMRRARNQVVVVSPYLVPGAAGVDVLQAMRRRGVKVNRVTNSLAATNNPLVHAGYRPYRTDMLELGVEL